MPFSNAKCCCNCQYWDGDRKVSPFKNMAEVKTMSDKGVCMNKKAVNSKGRPHRADHPDNCGGYEKWDQLK